MRSFLAYIADQYGRKKEDVATDVLAYLLKDPSVQDGLRDLLIGLGWSSLPRRFHVLSRTRGEHGTPDLIISEKLDDHPCLIIENKFWARLTEKQPCKYLCSLKDPDGLLLFVAPKARRDDLWQNLLSKCRAEKIAVQEASPFMGHTNHGAIAVASWESLLKFIEKHTSHERESNAFVDQLRRTCEMSELDEIKPLSATVMVDEAVAKQVFDCMRLSTLIIDAAAEARCFELSNERLTTKHLQERSGAHWVGKYGKIGTERAWIGFDARAWQNHSISPLWIEVEINHDSEKKLLSLFQPWIEEQRCFLESEPYQIEIPIKLTPGVGQDTLLSNALSQVKEVQELLSGSGKRRFSISD